MFIATLITLTTYGQENGFNAVFINTDVLYDGYPSQVKITVPEEYKNKVKVECIGCDKFMLWNPNQQEYAIKSKDTSAIILIFKNEKSDVVHKFTLPVKKFDQPRVLLDGKKSDEILTSIPENILLTKTEGKHQYEPKAFSWDVTLNGKSYFSIGTTFNQKLWSAMQEAKKGSFTIKIRYYNHNMELLSFMDEFQFDLK